MAVTVDWFGGFDGPQGPSGWALLEGLRDVRVVARSRTTLVVSGILDLPSGAFPVHRKTYAYGTLAAALAGAFRTTFAAPGRARLEVRALERLGALGFAPAPVALAERREAGLLREAMLAVRSVDGGTALDAAPPAIDLAAAVGRAAGAMHAAGLGRLSLAPRNVVVARGGPRGIVGLPVGSPTRGWGWTIAKVDSGRLADVRRGGSEQAADLADLLAGLEGRWSEADLAALREAYAAAAGAIPGGLDAAMAGARERLNRRRR
jgi:tRNA A-37 threonylcarbamoyl transferase component Bud32